MANPSTEDTLETIARPHDRVVPHGVISFRSARENGRPLWRTIAVAALCAGLLACDRRRQPSILLFVFDTTRVDAVSAYGHVRDTTPMLDALAASGLRYARAYSQAPWTLPSHTTLFTGLLPSQHGVGWRVPHASDDLTMLAERLRAAGYDTAGVAENPWISEAINMAQGFRHFDAPVPDAVTFVREWARHRRPGRPFFLFVNVVDAHNPYDVRESNPYLPPGVTKQAAALVSQNLNKYFCSATSDADRLSILRGLYLGDVHAADHKLAEVLAAIYPTTFGQDLITIVTADHGEHFGEHGLVSHMFSLHEELLHVPLVIHGLPGVAPAVIKTPVQLADVVPTVLGWLGLPIPGGLGGQPLPTSRGAVDIPLVTAEFQEMGSGSIDAGPVANLFMVLAAELRQQCPREARVFGDMRALIRYPFKLVSYANYPAELYDLKADPTEEHDLAAERPTMVAELTAALGKVDTLPRRRPEEGSPLPPKVLDRLRALGYVGGDSKETGKSTP